MNHPADGEVRTAADRIWEREAQIAALENGRDLWLAGAAPAEQLACLHGPLLADATRIGLVVVPDTAHPLCRAAQTPGRPVAAIVVAPDMDEAARRDLGIALRNHQVQLLFVTPERLAQPRFVAFVKTQSLAYVAVASCQRLTESDVDYFAPYGACRTLRRLFPYIPLAALADSVPSALVVRALAKELELRTDDVSATATEVSTEIITDTSDSIPSPDSLQRDRNSAHKTSVGEASPSPYVQSAGVSDDGTNAPREQVPIEANKHSPTYMVSKKYKPTQEEQVWRTAFPLFEEGKALDEVATALGRDPAWCAKALEHFIRDRGRTTPFPWVTQPDYLTVAMVAGQAESHDPRVVLPLLRERVSETTARLVLAALGNRPRPGGQATARSGGSTQ